MMRRIALVLVLANASLMEAAAQSPGEIPGPAEVFVENPFATPESLTAFKRYLDERSAQTGVPIEVPDGFWDAAPRLRYWGYTFRSGAEGSEVDFRQTYDVQPTVDSMIRTVGSLKKSSCSYYRAKRPRLASVDSKRIEVKADLDGKQRSCGSWPWGGEWKTNVADIEGDAVARIDFRTETDDTAVGRFNGRFVAGDPIVDVNPKVKSIFGVNVNSVGGQVLRVVAETSYDVFRFAKHPTAKTAGDTLNLVSSEAFRFEKSVTLSATYLAEENGSISSSKYNDFMSQVRRTTWSVKDSFQIDDKGTGFAKDPSGPVLLNLSYTSKIKPHIPVKTVYADAVREMELLRSFGEEDARVEIQRGDTLWKLARTHYGSGYFHNLISGYNLLSKEQGNNLQIGQSVVLPPMYKFEMVEGVYFVQPGDSAKALCQEWKPNDLKTCLKDLRAANPGVRLNRLKVLEPIILPRTEA